MKYIVFKGEGSEPESMILFPGFITHSDMAKGCSRKPVSAGFCIMDVEHGQLVSSCYGCSVSMGLSSRPKQDEVLLRILLKERIGHK